MKQMRYYQEEACQAVDESLSSGIKRQIVVLPTGTGKTFAATQIIKKYKRILWLTHNEELITQSANVLQEELMIRVGVIKQERMEIEWAIVVASIQTLWRRLDKLDENLFDCVVIDECHLAAAKSWQKCLTHFKAKLYLGLTATPHRADNLQLSDVFDKIVYDYPIEKAIEEGYLCEIDAIQLKTQISLDKVKTTAGELNQKDLKIVNCPERNKLIVEKYKEYCDGKQAIAFCVDIQHVMDLTATFKAAGINTDFVIGDKKLCPNRKERIERFKSGKTTVMINCMVLTMGFDHPDTGCIIMACPTKSLTKFMQAVGRGTRLKTTEYLKSWKQELTLLDVVDVTTRHRLINSWTLDKTRPIKERVFTTREKKDTMLLDLERVPSESRVESSRIQDQRVDLLMIPKAKKINSYKMKEPATPKQLAWIAALGYDVEGIAYTKAMCNDIISNLPATSKQLGVLKNKGFDISFGATRGEVDAAFDLIKKDEDDRKKKTTPNTIENNPFIDMDW